MYKYGKRDIHLTYLYVPKPKSSLKTANARRIIDGIQLQLPLASTQQRNPLNHPQMWACKL